MSNATSLPRACGFRVSCRQSDAHLTNDQASISTSAFLFFSFEIRFEQVLDAFVFEHAKWGNMDVHRVLKTVRICPETVGSQ